MSRKTGGFTMPGEAGFEDLTLELAKRWGADVIRDSDGTELSDDILNAGYGIYSTICIIRDHNEFAKAHPETVQQTFLMSEPVMAESDSAVIELLKGYYLGQFRLNDSPESMAWWQVFDRTANEEIPADRWAYSDGKVTVIGTVPYHQYTVNFLCYRIWEEISMYNHVTNDWGDKEHLIPIDPRYPVCREYMADWMRRWCAEHPHTTVVRFTSLFYNFVWIWGADERHRNEYTDWASYDFTVSVKALEDFREEYGYAITSEDFVNKGQLHTTHMPADRVKRDWMDFINRFVVEVGKELIDIVHEAGKKAYVFYDDSWVGLEPNGKRFPEFGFDGLIKCVFSGFEVRLCSMAEVETHEIRLHPYLFPVGLGGLPTFAEGGDPERDARQYWLHVRRGLLRAPIQRIGLGGYVHLTRGFDSFVDCIEELSDEFRDFGEMHALGKPYTFKPRVAVLHYWGRLRSWTLSGHFHETYMNDLIHINEALSGLPFDVDFLSFDDVKQGKLAEYDVVINAGRALSAWSGGDAWADPELVAVLTKWCAEGGAFIGVDEPSAVPGFGDYFRMAPVLGVDEDTGARVTHGRWAFEPVTAETAADEELADALRRGLVPAGATVKARACRFLTDGTAAVLAAAKVLSSEVPAECTSGEIAAAAGVTDDTPAVPALTVKSFGRGKGIYLGGFSYSPANVRMLQNLILFAAGEKVDQAYTTVNPVTECTFFPEAGRIVVINNTAEPQETAVRTPDGETGVALKPYGTSFIEV